LLYLETERSIQLKQCRNRLEEIRATVYSQRKEIQGVEMTVTGTGLGPGAIPDAGYKPVKPREVWGGLDETTWFRMHVRIPASMKGQRVVALIRPAVNAWIPDQNGPQEGGESLAYLNGKPVQGLDRNRDEILLADKARGNETFEIHLEATPGTRFNLYHCFHYADIAVFNPLPWDFYWDASVALDVVAALDDNFAPARQLLEVVNAAVKSVDLQHVGKPPYFDSLAAAQKQLRRGIKPFENSYGMGALTLAGHAHIDTAWLWPLRETQRKCSRTFSTVLALMDRYPEFHFSCSQPVQYEWMKRHYPDIFAGIKKRVKEGRWELCGAPWVEPDHNMPWGESLIRQYLYGNRWFQAEFGKRSHIAWVPDSFGYNWQLPQIMTKCQLTAFITTKMDWNQFTLHPYNFYLWEGADGTRIPAIHPPLNYNGDVQPDQLILQWEQFKQKERVTELPFAFGFGDGGGGPTAKMIEHGKRLKNMVGVPKASFGRIEDCVDRMVDNAELDKLPVFRDELYLELHRACQTTQARTKRNNRVCEALLHDTEFLAALAHLHGGEYDNDALVAAWKLVLTNQFHDILPGSSINEVYATCDDHYAKARKLAAKAQSKAVKFLLGRLDTSGDGTPIVVFNSRSWVRNDVVRADVTLPKGYFTVVDPEGKPVPFQKISKGELLFEATGVPPMGYAVYRVLPGSRNGESASGLKVTTAELENQYLRIELDAKGAVSRVYDKIEGREALAPGARGNVLQLFDDRPYAHDAWDIDPNFEEISWEVPPPESIEVLEEGPVRAVVRVVRKTEKSTITQDITLYAMLPRLDFVTHVDWHEKRTFLKVAFPVDVRASRATYEIQFGAIERTTHNSTWHDRARFEVPAQKWADLSEGNYGVSLLNDCKYAYDVMGNQLRLSLLRSSIDPDPHADEGEHWFTYSLYPHGGDWREGTVQQGFELNFPLLALEAAPQTGSLPAAGALVSTDAEHVLVDSVKKHEDSNALIVRVYEAYGQRGPVTLTFQSPPKKVTECDFMEENDGKVSLEGAELKTYFNPFEIKTYKVVF